MFFLGLLGVIGVIMYAAITGGSTTAFFDLPSLVVVFATSFFAGLAMSKGKFDERTISLTGDAAVIIGWPIDYLSLQPSILNRSENLANQL